MENFSEVLRLRRLLIFVISIVASLGGAYALIARYFQPIPAIEKLTKFETSILGVSERTPPRSSEPTHFEVRFLSKNAKYRYPFRYPNSPEIGKLTLDDKVVVWSDVGESYTIFQMHKSGRTIVAYDEVVKVARKAKFLDLALGIALLAAGSFGAWRFFTKFDFHAP